MSYHWPGNVRELRNVVERAVVLARGRMIGADELSFLQPDSEVCHLGTMTLKELEISHLKVALEATGWNISRAAEQLAIDRGTLARKIKRYRLART